MLTDNPLPMEIDCRATRAKLAAGDRDFVLIDCREQEEHTLVNIAGSVLMPMSQIEARVGELEQYQDGHVVVHCHLGGRSLRVAQWLRGQGFSKAQSMAGGIDQWAVEINPSLARY